ncbi:unnamed protein product, partial [Rotaria magnacalcarata]
MTETLLSIPLNVLDLRDNDFFMFIGQFCSQDVVEYLKLLEDYLELIDVKKKLAFRRSDGSYLIKIGVQYDINELTKNLRNALISKGQMTNDLAGRKAYEFLRINIPGSLPSLTTIQTKLAKEGLRAVEGEFRYNDMIKYMSTVNSKFAFCAEDRTTAERKIIYDTRSNSFVGFSPPLDEYGMPRMKYFQTDSIEDLQCWFEQEDISKLLNLYMIQP